MVVCVAFSMCLVSIINSISCVMLFAVQCKTLIVVVAQEAVTLTTLAIDSTEKSQVFRSGTVLPHVLLMGKSQA